MPDKPVSSLAVLTAAIDKHRTAAIATLAALRAFAADPTVTLLPANRAAIEAILADAEDSSSMKELDDGGFFYRVVRALGPCPPVP